MQETTSEILDGIQQELLESARFHRLKVSAITRRGNIWQLTVDPIGSRSALDESFEGAAAWWKGPPSGSADVLSIVPDTDQINIRFLTSSPPQKGEEIRIYPPRYLEALCECWEFSSWASACMQWRKQLDGKVHEELPDRARIDAFPKLRKAQRQAFGLLDRDVGFLWGPPGTGKTYTLGAMVSNFLCENPNAKVLLFSTTNSAVDQALISVDDQLNLSAVNKATAQRLRKRCLRIGSHFIASKYEGKMHLLPTLDEGLVQRLAELETHRPDPSDVLEYARWKDEVKALQRQIPKPLNEAQLAAMTTTLGAFIFEDLYQRRPFDLVVFDEASQVSLSHALMLAPLGRRVLFAGDDQQLAPIVQSDERFAAQKWLGRSIFAFRDNCATCFLDEQSRMEESICDVVSNVFYKGKLLVAEGCETNPEWRSERFVRDVPPMGKKNVYLHTCNEEGAFHPGYSGPVRFESAEFITELVQRIMDTMRADDIVILTPFRAQRTVIKAKLRRHGIRDVTVSTVHRAQGAECHTVIFDPVMANGKFFEERMGGRRLINVALSRAEARLIIVASPGDLQYPCLAQVSTILSHRGGPPENALPLEDIVFNNGFPDAFCGTVVRFKDWVGEISKSPEIDQFCLVDFHTGRTLKLKIAMVRRICEKQAATVV